VHKTQATLSIWKGEHNKQIGWHTKCPLQKTTEDLGIPMRKFTDKILGWSDRVGMCEAFHLPKTAANYTNLAYICNFLKKI
jgi:hypothetical protein